MLPSHAVQFEQAGDGVRWVFLLNYFLRGRMRLHTVIGPLDPQHILLEDQRVTLQPGRHLRLHLPPRQKQDELRFGFVLHDGPGPRRLHRCPTTRIFHTKLASS